MKKTKFPIFLITLLITSCDSSGNFEKGYLNINAIDNSYKFEIKLEVFNMYSTNNIRYFNFLNGDGKAELENILKDNDLIFELNQNLNDTYYLKDMKNDKTYYYFIRLVEDSNILMTASSVLALKSGTYYEIPIPYHFLNIEETGTLLDIGEDFSLTTKYDYSYFKDFYEKSPNIGYTYDVSEKTISLYDFFTIKIDGGKFIYDVKEEDVL